MVVNSGGLLVTGYISGQGPCIGWKEGQSSGFVSAAERAQERINLASCGGGTGYGSGRLRPIRGVLRLCDLWCELLRLWRAECGWLLLWLLPEELVE
jgi:hypothetical protein